MFYVRVQDYAHKAGILVILFLKWLTRKLDLENDDSFAIATHDLRSEPKGVLILRTM